MREKHERKFFRKEENADRQKHRLTQRKKSCKEIISVWKKVTTKNVVYSVC